MLANEKNRKMCAVEKRAVVKDRALVAPWILTLTTHLM
jgi:hypothetical protein